MLNLLPPRSTLVPVLAASLLMTSACASMSQSLMLGAAVGATALGTAGNLATRHSAEGTAIGALIGAGLGAVFGYLGHQDLEEKARLKETVDRAAETPKPPRLTRPKYREIWVPPKIEGDRYIEGHRLFIIEDPGKWTTE